MPDHIQFFVALSPSDVAHPLFGSEEKKRYTLDIAMDSVSRAYVFVDYPGMVHDGGYYYSVVLGSYCL